MTIIDEAGRPTRLAYRVEGGAIVVSADQPSHTVVTRIATDGRSACSATRDYIRKPGHRFFENVRLSNHQAMRDSDLRAENVELSIAETSD